MLQVNPANRPSCDQLLSNEIVLRHMDFNKALSNNQPIQMLGTIKMPRKMTDINQMLPKKKMYKKPVEENYMNDNDFNASVKGGVVAAPKEKKVEIDLNLNANQNDQRKGVIDLNNKDRMVNNYQAKPDINRNVINNGVINSIAKKDPVVIQRQNSNKNEVRPRTPILLSNNNVIKKENINNNVYNNIYNNNMPNKVINRNIVAQAPINNNVNNIISKAQKPVSSRPQSAKVNINNMMNNAPYNYNSNVKRNVVERPVSPMRVIGNNNPGIRNKSPINAYVRKPSGNNSPKLNQNNMMMMMRPQSGKDPKANLVGNPYNKVIEKIQYERKPIANPIRQPDNKNLKHNYHYKQNDQIIVANNNRIGFMDAIKVNNKPLVNNGPKIVLINNNKK